MWPAYQDLTEKLGTPLWYDQNGVPRYEHFHIGLSGNIYAQFLALMLVSCQECGRVFLVCSDHDHAFNVSLPKSKDTDDPWLEIGSFHYGDPPRHGSDDCASGDTMNSVPVRILEFWFHDYVQKLEDGTPNPHFLEWVRKPEYEIGFVALQDEKLPLR